LGIGKVAVDDVEVCSADGASLDANSDFAGPGSRIGALFEPQWLPHPMKNHRFHNATLLRLWMRQFAPGSDPARTSKRQKNFRNSR
jgi:hypothetical protein